MTTATPVPTRHTRRTVAIVSAAAVTALAMVFFMISSVTGAAWTDSTDNTGNSWATGTVTLTDDDAGVAMFAATNMVPGSVVTNDITVTNGSTVPLDVRLYGADLVDSDPSLAAHLNVTIGTTDGGTDVFSGTLAALSTSHTAFANGTPVIELAAANVGDTDVQQYWFSVELDDDAPSTLQAKTATISFVWEGQTQ